jgi:uncharacterized protein
MKIRAITIGLDVEYPLLHERAVSISKSDPADVLISLIQQKLDLASRILGELSSNYYGYGFTVQTCRLCFNSWEEWLLPCSKKSKRSLEAIVGKIAKLLQKAEISFCSFGCTINPENFHLVPIILAASTSISCSIVMQPPTNDSSSSSVISPGPDHNSCLEAAKVCLSIAERNGDLGNFQFCVGFNTPANIPFFPIAYHASRQPPTVSVSFENGDLIFIGCFGADTIHEARDNLISTFQQIYSLVSKIGQDTCDEHNIHFAGIDGSLNPGLSVPDSIVAGLEHIIKPKKIFGSFGTLAAVSAVTSALKTLVQQQQHQTLPNSSSSSSSSAPNVTDSWDIGEDTLATTVKAETIATTTSAVSSSYPIKFVGYNGLMLPVMEDLTLAARAAEEPAGTYTLRDLLVFSSVCGVGLDTVPIPGDSLAEDIAAVYMEVGTMAFRLQKPLTARLLPMKDKKAGDLTEVSSPYLCNTKVFSL